jgi:hypothetical protein
MAILAVDPPAELCASNLPGHDSGNSETEKMFKMNSLLGANRTVAPANVRMRTH